MSYNYQAKVIFGFPLPKYPSKEFLGKDDKGYQVYLDEWLELNGFRPLEQINAGGGDPEFLVGVTLHELNDFTRATPYVRTDRSGVQKPPTELVATVREALEAECGVQYNDIGYYLVGERA